MKKLIFIDNDSDESSREDLIYVQYALEDEISENYMNSIQTISNFYRLEKEEMRKMIFNPDNCILTYSMYTYSHYNSLGQVLSFLKIAGEREIEGCTYYDASGNLPKALYMYISQDDSQGVFNIIKAIENNYILSYQDGQCIRMTFQAITKTYTCFNFNLFNLQEHLNS